VPAACRETPPPGLLKGIEEFNRGEFYQCHDTLEELWMAEARPIRHLYQGILQIGVAFYHLGRGRYRPALSLLQSGSDYLQPFSPICMGVHVDPLREGAFLCRSAVVKLGPEGLNEFDWTLVPRIRVTKQRPKVDHTNE
jgi:predicted metal-dependent hydrolase